MKGMTQKSKSKKVKYKEGDVFLVPSSREGFYIGQVAVNVRAEIGAIFCYFFSKKVGNEDGCHGLTLTASDVISASFVTPEMIEFREWPICANMSVPKHPELRRFDELRSKGYVGAVITGGGLLSDYLDTYYGIIDSSVWPDPQLVFSFFLAPPSRAESLQ